jgi:arginyl-tRNA synthetase
LGSPFDVFFSEKELHDAGAIESAVARLREQGHVFDDGGAVWLRTTDFGDDKDRVMIRANGEPTYFAADAAYYLSKKDRGFTEKIYLLGADHHGYINRLKAIAACAGDDPEVNIEVLIGQLVSVNGAKLSKRAGNIIELKDLISWLGKDAVRYSLARFPADSPLTLDPELLKKHSNENPVFYVQYAHARSCGTAQKAAVAPAWTGPFSTPHCWTMPRKTSFFPTWAATRRSSPRLLSCASRTAWPATLKSSLVPITAGTTLAGSLRRAKNQYRMSTARVCG